jgi:subtilisin family serine protease
MRTRSTILRALTLGAILATAACENAGEPLSPAVEPSQALTSANDEYFRLQWGLSQIGAQAAWSVSTGRKQVIAIVDTGVDLSHPDLQAKLVPGATFTGCADTGPCGNGDWKSGTPQASRPQSPATGGGSPAWRPRPRSCRSRC